ncbi:DUF3226 domain-containing protein [Zoogloea sp.]|uniref:DUF3226 domain-containing protein n=1 Tax=Zoogloea sp. TaxID=49181 RepID=UPI0035ADC931
MSKNSLLLVEGQTDKAFFEALCKSIGIETEIKIGLAREYGQSKNTKQAVINSLKTLIHQMQDGTLKHLAIVVDADRISDGGGFRKTIDQISDQISTEGYSSHPICLNSGGLLYKHNDGLPNFGVWVMPDNAAEGMLEDWIKLSISPSEKPLLEQATATVGSIANKKFPISRLSKAEVTTWLAWQKKPGEGLYYTAEDNLLDRTAQPYTGLVEWLKTALLPQLPSN